jgi:ribosomal protein S18 acetylase RimI-like enzyme
VNVRRVTRGERATIHALYREFYEEHPLPAYAQVNIEEELGKVDQVIDDGIALLAEDSNGQAVGFALAWAKGGAGFVSDLFVRPHARGRGAGRALTRTIATAFREQGLSHVMLTVDWSNTPARSIYERWGFEPRSINLVVPLERLEKRLDVAQPGPSFGSIHVQTDDQPAVERAVRQFVPRLPGRSRGSLVSPARSGWIAVYDDVCDRDPKQLRRLAREISDRMGAVVVAIGVEEDAVVRYVLHERGGVVDEYLSVQEYYGPLPPGEVVALAANPRVVARLTGADPEAVRAAAVHAASPAQLPPPSEVLAGIAAAIGLEGAGYGWHEAPELPGAIRVDRE